MRRNYEYKVKVVNSNNTCKNITNEMLKFLEMISIKTENKSLDKSREE